MKRSIIILSLVSLAIVQMSFSVEKEKKTKAEKRTMKTLNSFTNFIPSGVIYDDVDTLSVNSFYMSTTEVTNLEYLEFLYSLKQNGKTDLYNKYAVDTSQWTEQFPMAFLEPMEQYYHNHPAYFDYPVVNVSKEAAIAYCEWLTEHYKGMSENELDITFRLPTQKEWVYASNGSGDINSYSWGGNGVTDSGGNYLANFSTFGPENITRDQNGELIIDTTSFYDLTKDGHTYTAPVYSFLPNEFGLYNMNGNVSEMLLDGDEAIGGNWHSPGADIKNTSVQSFSTPEPTIGFRVVAVVE